MFYIIFVNELIQIKHLVPELLDIIDDDEGIRSHLRECEEEILEVFSLHCINIDEIIVAISEARDHQFGISPDRMDIFELAVPKILNRKIVHIPRILNRRDIRSIGEHTRKVKCRISIRCTDLEEMFWIFFLDEVFEEYCILLCDIGDLVIDPDLTEVTERECDDL
jgi:hypothetical protein